MRYHEPFLGSEALAAGALTRGQLRWNYDNLLPDVYLAKGAPHDLTTRTRAAWLWTGRRGIVAGQAATALYTRKPIDKDAPVELIAAPRRPRDGVVIRTERIADDEIRTRDDMRMTSPARTALDLARFVPRLDAIGHLDRLADATDVWPEDVAPLVLRYRGARGITGAMGLVRRMDAGAVTPQESRLRLRLRGGGVPAPETNIILGEWPSAVRISMGWRKFRVGVHVPDEPAPTLMVREAKEAERRAMHGWLILTAVPGRDENGFVHAVRQTLWEQVRRARKPG